MIEMIFGLLVITNISCVASFFSEYFGARLLKRNKLQAEVIQFEQKRKGGGRGGRSNFYSLIFFQHNGMPHTFLIGRDRKDYIGRRISICYNERKNIVLRNAVRKTYYLNSRLVQGLYYFLIIVIGGVDLCIQIICFKFIDENSYMMWMIMAVLTLIVSLILSCIYKTWEYQRLNS